MIKDRFVLPELVKFASSSLGISEIDVKATGWKRDYDIYIIKLWNYRTIEVTGLEFYRFRKVS